MVAPSTWRPRQPYFEGTNATDQTSTAPAARTPGPARDRFANRFFKEGDASPTAASLLLLLAGDVETNPATPAARTSVSPTHPSAATHEIAVNDPTNKHDAVAPPDLNSPYQGIAQPTVDPGLQLPLRRPTPATAAITRSDQAPGPSLVLLRAA